MRTAAFAKNMPCLTTTQGEATMTCRRPAASPPTMQRCSTGQNLRRHRNPLARAESGPSAQPSPFPPLASSDVHFLRALLAALPLDAVSFLEDRRHGPYTSRHRARTDSYRFPPGCRPDLYRLDAESLPLLGASPPRKAYSTRERAPAPTQPQRNPATPLSGPSPPTPSARVYEAAGVTGQADRIPGDRPPPETQRTAAPIFVPAGQMRRRRRPSATAGPAGARGAAAGRWRS